MRTQINATQVLGSGCGVSEREAEFYLEMTGWNIQEALSSYTEVNREGNMLLAMSFVKVRTYYIPIRFGASKQI